MSQTELFGPDLGRGPFTGHRLETAAVQIAAAIAQLRAPLLRSDDEIRGHIDFIRELADRLAPEYAQQVFIEVGAESSNAIETTIRVQPGGYSLLHCWLADAIGGGETALAPSGVAWLEGALVKDLTSKANFVVVTSAAGVARARVDYSGARTWRWGVSRYARAYYSTALTFA